MLTHRQIEVFRAVVQKKQISEAARFLNVSQPSVSRLLMDMERSSGITLFERKKNKVIPNSNALFLYKEVEKSFIGLQEISNKIEMFKRTKQQQLHIVGLPLLMNTILPPLVALFFRDKVSQSGLKIDVRASHTVLYQLTNNFCDIGFISDIAFHREQFLFVDSFSLPCVCIFPKGHKFSGEKTISLNDLDGENFISTGAKGPFNSFLLSHLKETRTKVNMLMETYLFDTTSQLVALGLGLSITDIFTARKYQDQIDYCFINEDLNFNIHMIIPRYSPYIETGVNKFRSNFIAQMSDFLLEK